VAAPADADRPTDADKPADADKPTDADKMAERHLVRRMIVGTAILIPIAVTFFALLVGLAVRNSGVPLAGPIATGAGIGVLAGLVSGMWAGFLASASEFEDLEQR
jgi:hypothetical protein